MARRGFGFGQSGAEHAGARAGFGGSLRHPPAPSGTLWQPLAPASLGHSVYTCAYRARVPTQVHMAGRTGRQGAEGTCITLLEHRQAPRLVAFAEALGVPFRPL